MRNSMLSKRAVSPIVATVLLIALVSAASGIAAYIILNINEINLPQLTGEKSKPQKVIISFYLSVINDTDSDGYYDTISFKLNLDLDSPTIYVQDVDVVLLTGQTLDDYAPWLITTSSQNWNDEMAGYVVPAGIINATFTVQNSNLSSNKAELLSGQSFHLIITYYYQVETGYRVTTNVGFYETSVLSPP